jgi:hypothetical protein
MSTFPRECTSGGVITPEEGFYLDRSSSSGRKSRCKTCYRRDVNAYNDAVRKPRRIAVLEAEFEIKMKALERERKRRVRAARKAAEEGAKRQRELLRELGVPDLSPEEVLASARQARGVCRRGLRP